MRIAVTGATGRLGGQVAKALAATGDHQVIAVSRRPAGRTAPAARLTAAVADYSDLPALRAALQGVDTLVFVSSDGETVHVLRHHQNVIQAAADNGVGHIVALSALDADTGSPFCYGMSYGYTEQMLYDSGCAISIARASIYTEFFLQLLTLARSGNEIRLPAADGRISLVSRADVGRCLAALAVGAPTSQHHDITGPEAPGLATIATMAASQWGTPLGYANVTPADFQIDLARGGEEAWWCYAYSTMFDSVREQRWASVSGEVLRLTGRPPAPVRDVLAQAAGPDGTNLVRQ
jgi:NAD(P)H dehydrogenase (quinone)